MDSTKDLKQDINYFTSELVYYHLKTGSEFTAAQLAERIGVSVSFLNKALQSAEGKHFNVRHLVLIAAALKIDVCKLLPCRQSYRLLTGKDLSSDEWDQAVENYRKGSSDLYD